MRILAEIVRFGLCLAIVIVGAYCAFEISTFFNKLGDSMERSYYQMRMDLE
jgi:hypothetical protein